MLAVDSSHVDCAITLKRIYVFFALEVGRRYVHILWDDEPSHRTLNHPASTQPAMDLDDRAATFQFLIRDRAGQLTTSFDAVLAQYAAHSTAAGHSERCSFAHHSPIIPPRVSTASESGANRFSAA